MLYKNNTTDLSEQVVNVFAVVFYISTSNLVGETFELAYTSMQPFGSSIFTLLYFLRFGKIRMNAFLYPFILYYPEELEVQLGEK